MNYEETESLTILIVSNKGESVILKLLKNKSLEPNSFTGKFYQTFKKELVPIPLRLFQKTEKERLPNSFIRLSLP